MTAFGRARAVSPSGRLDITAELRSVNSRYLDCTVKLPRMYSFMEDKVKTLLAERGITRGKLEVYIGIDVIEQTGINVVRPLAAAGLLHDHWDDCHTVILSSRTAEAVKKRLECGNRKNINRGRLHDAHHPRWSFYDVL